MNPRSTAAAVNPRSTAAAVVADYSRPCRHLDQPTSLCTVYEDRFRVCGECRRMTVIHVLFVNWLPESCGYVRRYRIWLRSAG